MEEIEEEIHINNLGNSKKKSEKIVVKYHKNIILSILFLFLVLITYYLMPKSIRQEKKHITDKDHKIIEFIKKEENKNNNKILIGDNNKNITKIIESQKEQAIIPRKPKHLEIIDNKPLPNFDEYSEEEESLKEESDFKGKIDKYNRNNYYKKYHKKSVKENFLKILIIGLLIGFFIFIFIFSNNGSQPLVEEKEPDEIKQDNSTNDDSEIPLIENIEN